MKRVRLDKIASATKTANLNGTDVHVSPDIVAKEGYVIAVRILTDKSVYNEMENLEGRMTRLKSGDVIAGVLGHRRALHGYEGDVPEAIAVGDTIQVLNKGGVLGVCTSHNPDVGKPFDAEVLGAVLHFPYTGERVGEPAHIGLGAIPEVDVLTRSAPIVGIVGTCMNSGKTVATCEIIHGLVKSGKKVAAGKVTGVSLQSDVLNMMDFGAFEAGSFMDAGIATTSPESAPDVAKRLVSHLNRKNPDVIVLEFGDGLFGEYGVGAILKAGELTPHLKSTVLCANDPVGAWGGVVALRDQFDIQADVVTGPITDNEVGCRFIREKFDIPAHNARTSSDALNEAVLTGVLQHVSA
jgi:hypothetical protein